jgi:hypothetical protein
MATSATLMKEIEKLPEESVAEVFNFVLFLRTRASVTEQGLPKAKSMFGFFPGIATDVEREDEDRA